jgi:centrosomal protein CEP135
MKGNKLSADVTTILPRESFDLADEKRFQTLRKHLTDEGYTQVLGFESMPLVHRLWDDLCALRDTHTTMARNLSEKGANEAKLQRQIHPIQKELSRMVRENNQLHLELIQRSEEFDTHQRRTSLDTNKFQTKIADQAFIISQQAHHIRELEKQVDEYRGKIDQLLDPNFTYTTGPAGETVPKGQEIIVSACPKPHEVGGDEGEVAQVVQDLESITADQIAKLEEDLKESNKKHEFLELEVHSLKDAIRNRE